MTASSIPVTENDPAVVSTDAQPESETESLTAQTTTDENTPVVNTADGVFNVPPAEQSAAEAKDQNLKDSLYQQALVQKGAIRPQDLHDAKSEDDEQAQSMRDYLARRTSPSGEPIKSGYYGENLPVDVSATLELADAVDDLKARVMLLEARLPSTAAPVTGTGSTLKEV
jgi:hypothetical protein